MYQRFITGIFFLSLSLSGFAQVKFSDNPDEFIGQAGDYMKNTKKEECIQAFDSFSAAWNTLGPETKKSIVLTSQMMSKKRLYSTPHFADFFTAVGAAVNIRNAGTQLDSFLFVTQKTLETFDNKQIREYFSTSRAFFEKYALYYSSFNQLAVNGGSFKFKFIETAPVQTYELPGSDESSDGWGDPNDHFDDWDNPEQVEENWDTGWEDSGWGDSGSGWDDSGWESEPEPTTDPVYENTESFPEQNVFDYGYVAPPQPPVSGPVIEFENVDFHFVSQHDSTVLKGTNGSFMFKDHVFVGEGGTFDWTSVGLAPEECYVEFKEYNFNTKSPKLSAEPVELHYPSRTDSIVEGVFDFQSKKHTSEFNAEYPRFKSFASNIPVKGIGDNIKYYGGLSLAGRKIYSSSIDEGKSKILIQRNGETKVKAIANRFELGDSLITGDIATIVVYQEQDSIYHPGTIFQYKKNENTLRLTKTSSYRLTPFTDSYHNMDIIVDALIWNLDSSNIQFRITNAATELTAKFESKEYFDAGDYSRLQGIYRFHPLQMLFGYAESIKPKSDSLYPVLFRSDVAKKFNVEDNTLKGAMVALMRGGYIDYNTRTGEIKLREKAVHFVLARRDKKDYDNMKFESLEPSGYNATLNLENNELTVRGVDKIHIMDSLNVFIIPESKTVILKDNRNFKFDGKINTANFQFLGKEFEFNYDSFLVHMPEIDQIRLAAVNPNEKNSKDKKTRVLGNELRYSSGTLYINKPDNKSGRKSFPEYPIFDANSGASVFFDKQEIAGGALDTTIRFKIPPFVVDSLASDDPQAIGFDGTFESGGIFPDFETKLVVMPDFSLGFEYKVPEDGFQLYEGKGKYYKKITMDNRGLTGDGRIQFLNTTCYSAEFHFFKDSVLTIGTNAETTPGTNPDLAAEVTFPDFTLNEYEMHWKPRKDSMYLTNHSNPFRIYDSTATLNGTANITEHGMFGSGVLETRGSVSASDRFHFEETRYGGRHTTFTVRSDNPSKPALRSTDCKLQFDLEKGEATFSPEISGFASTEFPYLKYKTSIEKGVWYLDDKKVVMNKPEGSSIASSYFYSTHPTQDSLVFNATAGIYDMTSLSLNIEGVPFIKVMDGKIFPDSNKVVIKENASMETLVNAKAEFDTSAAFHKLYDGTFDIKGRFKLKGEASYSYTNPSGDHYSFKFKNYTFVVKEDKHNKKKGEQEATPNVQTLLAENRLGDPETEDSSDTAPTNAEDGKKKKKKGKKNDEEVSTADTSITQTEGQAPLTTKDPTNRHTIALGLIFPEDSIELSKKIFYKGKVTMYSDIKPLFFDGFVKLDLKGALSYSQWLEYKNDGDTTDIKIVLEDPKADNGNLLTTGMHLTKDYELYTTFISEKDNAEDFDIFTTKGVLKFTSHPDSAIFKVASPQKFLKPVQTKGNLFNYDDNNSIITYEGSFNYIEENDGLEILASGSGKALLDSSFYDFNNLLAFKFNKVHKTIPAAIGANLKLVTDILPPDSSEYADISFEEAERRKQDLYSKVCSAAGEKALENMMTKTQLLCEVSKDFGDAIVVSDVDMKWSNRYKAWYSTGKLKISNIHGETIDRVVNGYVEIRKTMEGDFVTLLIAPTEHNWYYFTYDNNRIAITTSNDEVNAVIGKKSKGELPTRDKLFFVQADLMEKENFLRLFKERYLGFSEEAYTPTREIKDTDVPVEELDIPEEEEEEYIEEEPLPEGEAEPEKKNNEGKVIDEPEWNREEKHHDIEQKKQMQQDQQKMKDLFK